MTTYKIAELTGVLLDAAVAIACGQEPFEQDGAIMFKNPQQWPGGNVVFRPSENWSDAGPIIERERIAVEPKYGFPGTWCACFDPSGEYEAEDRIVLCEGESPLIAAMRAYVYSKFGNTVELE